MPIACRKREEEKARVQKELAHSGGSAHSGLGGQVGKELQPLRESQSTDDFSEPGRVEPMRSLRNSLDWQKCSMPRD